MSTDMYTYICFESSVNGWRVVDVGMKNTWWYDDTTTRLGRRVGNKRYW